MPVASGDLLSESDRVAIDAAIRQAEQLCRHEFSVYVGPAEGDSRAFATSLHNSLVAPARSILVMVDPRARVLEVVTGGHVRRTLTDAEVSRAVEVMQRFFAEGDLVDGLRSGILAMAQDDLD